MFNFESPDLLWLIIPVIAIGIYLLKKASKKGLIVTRTVVVILLIIALASPYVIIPSWVVNENPNIVLISDESDSMRLFDDRMATNLYEALTANTPTTLVKLTGDRTALGDAIMQYSTGDNQIVMITDGNSNTGADLEEALVFAKQIGTTVYYVKPELKNNDMSVQVKGDKTVLLNAPTRFEVIISQAATEENSFVSEVDIIDKHGKSVPVLPPRTLTFEPDSRTTSRSFSHVFNEVGAYTIVARIKPSGDDYYDVNNIFYKTVFVIPQPKVHLVTTNPSSSFATNLRNLYRLTTSTSISDIKGIDEQKAVVLDNIHALSITEEEAILLHEYISNGGGLYLVGGDTAFNKGSYLNSSIENLLPVISRPSESTGEKYVIIVVDITESTQRGGPELTGYDKSPRPKPGQTAGGQTIVETNPGYTDSSATWPIIINSAKNIIASPDFKDVTLGILIVGEYNGNVPETMLPLVVPQYLNLFQESLDNISNAGRGKSKHDLALTIAKDMIETGTDDPGASKTIIFIGDGEDIADTDFNQSYGTAKNLVDMGYNIRYIRIESSAEGIYNSEYGVKTNSKAEEFMKIIGVPEGYQAVDGVKDIILTDIVPKKEDVPQRDDFEDILLEIIEFNPNHPITRNLNVYGNITGYNEVTPKAGSERILVTNTGNSVLTTWRYGLGRVAALSTDNGNPGGWSNELFSRNANLTSSTINWVAGNPRDETGAVVEAPDTWYGTPSRVVLTMYDQGIPILRLNGNNVEISLIGNNVYEATVNPSNIGVHDLSGYPLAVNYALEYRDVGLNEELPLLLAKHNVQTYNENEARANLLTDARQHETLIKEIVSHKMYFLLAALIIFLGEVIVRRIREIREMKKMQSETQA